MVTICFGNCYVNQPYLKGIYDMYEIMIAFAFVVMVGAPVIMATFQSGEPKDDAK
jgi:uncharacterized membrane protein